MKARDAVTGYFRSRAGVVQTRIADLLAELVRQKTVNVLPEKLGDHPYLRFPGEEYRVADIVKRELDRTAIRYDEFAGTAGRPNIIARLGRNAGGERLLVPAHMDVVPAGEGWTTDPWECVEKNGFMHGRGVADNKGPLAALVVAVQALKELELDDVLAGELLVGALADEEANDPSGANWGVGYLLRERLISPTCAVVPDIGKHMKGIDVAEKGRLLLKITTRGTQAHGSTPELGVNALFPMARLVSAIEGMRLQHRPHALLAAPTMNIGEIRGGVAANVVPGSCSIHIDIRTVPGMTTEGIRSEFGELCRGVAGGSFEMETLTWIEPHEIPADNAVVRAILSNARSALGIDPAPIGLGGITYAKALNVAGIPAVGWGPGDEAEMHAANERVSIRELADFAHVVCLVALDLLAGA